MRRNLFCLTVLCAASAFPQLLRGQTWQATAGAESPDRGSQALAFLPNELWIHAGDTIQWTFPSHERHTVSVLRAGQTRPPNFGPTFGVLVGCPGVTPDGSSFDGSACITSDVLRLPENVDSPANAPTYSITFPATGNFKFVCLVHADMTGVVHVLDPSQTLPHDQSFYDREARSQADALFANTAQLRRRGEFVSGSEDQNGNSSAAGVGAIVTTGMGSQTASLMRFLHDVIVVRVGDTVEWTNLDPSISHTVTFGTEPADPRTALNLLPPALDGARQAIISSPSDNVSSGFLSATPQDRANLPQVNPNATRFRVTFTSSGIFNYVCAIHDELGMQGTVIVHP